MSGHNVDSQVSDCEVVSSFDQKGDMDVTLNSFQQSSETPRVH